MSQKKITLKEQPFSITFNYNGKSIEVKLKNGEDLLLIAKIFSDFLTKNNIDNIITEL